MNEATIREFTVSTDIWPIVEVWSEESQYQLMESSESSRLYRRGGLAPYIHAPWAVEIWQEGSEVRLEAWVKRHLFQTLVMPFAVPSEMGIESGEGRVQGFARNIARREINELLQRLEQPPIE